MNVLFISTKGPLPAHDGHCLRTYNLLKNIASVHKVHLLSFVKFEEEYPYQGDLKEFCATVEFIPLPENKDKKQLIFSALINLFEAAPFVARKYDSPLMRKAIRKITREVEFDLIHLDMLPLGVYLNEFVGMKVFLNQHNVESALLARRVESEKSIIKKIYFSSQQKRLADFEKYVVRGVDHIAACSEVDKDLLMEMALTTPVTVVPNGVDTDYFSNRGEQVENNRHLVFIGGMNWFPNRDALEWFDGEILPVLLSRGYDVVVHVIGKDSGVFRIKNKNNFVFHGYVDDVRPYLESAAVFIVPLRIGGGTRLKILDAMSMSKAIVSTSVGAEGLEVQHEINIIIADTPENFSNAIIVLLENIEKRQQMKISARYFVENKYKWNVITNNLLGAYQDIIAK